MPTNNLQLLYNRLERSFASAEETLLRAEKLRQSLAGDYGVLLAAVRSATADMQKYPKAQLVKRLRLMETVLQDLQLRHAGENRGFQAIGFLLTRLQQRLASEMLEPRLYGKIRSALAEEAELSALREKNPAADTLSGGPPRRQRPQQARNVRLMLVGVNSLYYAIPVKKILRKSRPGPLTEGLVARGFASLPLPGSRVSFHRMPLAIAFSDFAGRRRLLFCDEYFTPVEVPQKALRRMVEWAPPADRLSADFRPQVRFYGRRFFVYGARLSYTVRPGERKHPAEC